MSLDKITFNDRVEVGIKSSTQSARLDGDTRFSLLGKQMPAEKLAEELLDRAIIDFAGYCTRRIEASCCVDGGFPNKVSVSCLELEYSPLGYEGPIKRVPVPNSKKSKEAKRVGGFTCESLMRPNVWQAWRGLEPTCAKTDNPCPVVAQVSKLVEAAYEGGSLTNLSST